VPDFLPFAGIRFDLARVGPDLAALVAPPYDVIDEDLRVALEAAHPYNAVRVLLPRDVAHEGDRYDHAARRFVRWNAEGALAVDPVAGFYTYRMDYRDTHGRSRHTLGVVGALALPAAGDESVLPHERTLPKAKSDRLSLLRAMRVNVDPIWGLSPSETLTRHLGDALSLGSCVDVDGVRHELGVIHDAGCIAAIRNAVASAPLVLADGHHRFETALTYLAELAASGQPVAGAGAIMCLVVQLADDQLCIEPIHRLATVPEGIELRDRIAGAFEVIDLGPNTAEAVEALERRMANEGGLGLVDARGLALARPRAEVSAAALAAEPEPVRSTDAALVEAVVAPRIPEATWEYRHDAVAVAALVDKRAASAALLLRPVSVADTRAAALAGVRMPQKTTFFWPKPRSGMVFRSLD
jgi:uncharacterized protein (DUF1015 family)